MEGVVMGKNTELSAPDSQFGVWTAGEWGPERGDRDRGGQRGTRGG